jgi:hypothetical protein
MGRAFDPALLGIVDQGHFPEPEDLEDDDFTLVETCTICGTQDLVFEDDRLVDLDGEAHVCPAI